MNPVPTPIQLEARGIRKEYPGTVALKNVSVRFDGGKVHALIGRNGAGKSTLVRILAGSTQPTAGQVLLDGEPVELRSPGDAFRRGIATVYQELSLVPGLTVAENILLGRMPRSRGPFIDWAATAEQAHAVLATMDVEMDVDVPVGRLGFAQQQTVEIAKAMSFRPSVLMLDEPTSGLARHETQSLFRLVRQLAEQGVAILYISHRLQELREIADRVTVLRDGDHVATVEMEETTAGEIVHYMFGETVQKERPADLLAGREPVLLVRGLSRGDEFQDVNLALHRGEILGIAGMLGSGRTELLKAIFGALPFDHGEILVSEKTYEKVSPSEMKNLGLGFAPEDRKQEGLVQAQSIRSNLCLASLDRISSRGFLNRRRERRLIREQVDRLHIKAPDVEEAVSSLSGGNQQKVVVGKWLGTSLQVLLLDEPTRGIDLQAKQQIFQLMWDLSRQGIAILFVSSELEELVEVCHRILVMKHGRIEQEVRPENTTADQLFVQCM
ncbi:MAG: sugar ABC transporter ATP-binding protein [Candidatus Aminicenantes bacterium]|nr:sugar ABC transporter ATP-binding protein [Candidatus Aminicenantes bacterium]